MNRKQIDAEIVRLEKKLIELYELPKGTILRSVRINLVTSRIKRLREYRRNYFWWNFRKWLGAKIHTLGTWVWYSCDMDES